MEHRSRAVVQKRGKAEEMAVCGLFSAFIAVGAFIKIVIPVGADTMNFTLQWLFVLLAGLLLGSRRAFFSVASYLVIGLVGFPVFARGGGLTYLLRPTFGFLLGFALAAYVTGKISERVRFFDLRIAFLAVTVGYVVYYGMGILYFYGMTHMISGTSHPLGMGAVFLIYCLPTMLPDYLLCILAVLAAKKLRPAISGILE